MSLVNAKWCVPPLQGHYPKLNQFDIPFGCKVLRQIVDLALASKLTNSATKAMHLINGRARNAVQALPPFSELWLYNKDNLGKRISDSQRDAFMENDRRLGNYVHGYLDYFGEKGVEAINTGLVAVASSASHSLFFQIDTIVDHVQDEKYQIYLLQMALFGIKQISDAACAKRVTGVLSLSLLDLSLEKVKHKNTLLLIWRRLSEIVIDTAKAGILEYMPLVDFVVSSISVADQNSEIVPKAIEVLCNAGELLQTVKDFSERKELIFVRDELLQRIDQLAEIGLQHGVQNSNELAQQAKARLADNSGIIR